MKKNFFFALSLFMGLWITSCNSSEQPESSYFPVQCEEDGRWGMINQNGEFLFQDEFEKEPTSVVNGVFVVKEGDTYSIYEAIEKPKVIADGFKEIGMLNDKLIPAVKDRERISIINQDGEQVFILNPHNGKEIEACDYKFSDGLLAVKNEDGKWGYVNKKGEMVITPKYDYYTPFSDGLAVVLKTEKEDNSSVLVINKKGEQIMELKGKKFNLQSPFKNGLAVVEDKEKEKIGFIDLDGEFKKVPKKVKSIKNYVNDVFTYVNEDGKWGVMGLDENHTEYIRPKYSYIQILSSEEFLVQDDKDFFIMNKEGDKILDFGDDYDDVSSFGSNFIVKEGSIYMIYDKENKPVNKNEYFKIENSISKFFTIDSYYFDVDGVAQVIADCISDKGIDKYTLGETTSKYLKGNIEDYKWSFSFSDTELYKKGYKYHVDFSFVSDEALVNSNWDGWSNSYSYSKNPNAKIESISLSAKVDKYGEQVKEKLISILEKKGWKNDNGTLTSNGKSLSINAGSDFYCDVITVRLSNDPGYRNSDVVDPAVYADSTAYESDWDI